jgi:hypothetical protein
MMRLHQLLLCVAMLLYGSIDAQEPQLNTGKKDKPNLFASLPDSFEVDKNALLKIFEKGANDLITLQLSNLFSIEGKVVDKNQHNPGSLSINLRLSNYNNALFNISLSLLADNSNSMRGRILHPKYNDILVLYKEKEKYFFKKNTQQLYMPE